MASVLKWLILVTVAWCSLHIAEPAHAHDDDALHAHVQTVDADDEAGHGSSKINHPAHHHCPIAPDLRIGDVASPIRHEGAPVFERPVARLSSRSHAPPLQPPAA